MSVKPFKSLLAIGVEKRYRGVVYTHHDVGYFRVRCFEVAGFGIYLECDITSEPGSVDIFTTVMEKAREDGVSDNDYIGGVYYDVVFNGMVARNKTNSLIDWHLQRVIPFRTTVAQIVSVNRRGR